MALNQRYMLNRGVEREGLRRSVAGVLIYIGALGAGGWGCCFLTMSTARVSYLRPSAATSRCSVQICEAPH